MSAADILLTLAIVAVLCVITIAANYADRNHSRSARQSVFVALLLINALIVMVYGVLQVTAAYSSAEDAPEKSDAWIALGVSVAMAVISSVLMLQPVRNWLARLFPRRTGPPSSATSGTPAALQAPDAGASGTPLFPQMLNYYTAETREQTAQTQAWALAGPNT